MKELEKVNERENQENQETVVSIKCIANNVLKLISLHPMS